MDNFFPINHKQSKLASELDFIRCIWFYPSLLLSSSDKICCTTEPSKMTYIFICLSHFQEFWLVSHSMMWGYHTKNHKDFQKTFLNPTHITSYKKFWSHETSSDNLGHIVVVVHFSYSSWKKCTPYFSAVYRQKNVTNLLYPYQCTFPWLSWGICCICCKVIIIIAA